MQDIFQLKDAYSTEFFEHARTDGNWKQINVMQNLFRRHSELIKEKGSSHQVLTSSKKETQSH